MTNNPTDPGSIFTERYLKMMFSGLRNATIDDIHNELRQCEADNRKPIRIPRKFRNFFHETAFTASNGFKMPVFKADGSPDKAPVVFLHGGAFIYQPVFFHWRFLHDITIRSHRSVIMPIYPKSPEYQCATAVETLLEFLQTELQSDNVVLIGDSAGGCLATVLTQELWQHNSPYVEHLITISPCLDLSYSQEAKMREYQNLDQLILLERLMTITAIWRGELPECHPWASPVFGNLKALEGSSLFVGTDELLRADAELLHDSMQKQELQIDYQLYNGMFHTFPLFPIPEGFEAVKKIAAWLQ